MKEISLKTRVIESNTYEPYKNLAIEEYLLNHVEDNEVILYLWQNENTIVFGRNQNPWRECKVDLFKSDGGNLVRRLSGGGTVFHDLGNMNFTFLMKKKHYDLNKQLKVIVSAVKSLGIDAEFKGRNDIVANDRKFSGNAFYQGRNGSFQHGTILFDVDIYKLQNYLQVSKDKIESKGIKSVSSRVINLKELNPEITIDSLKKAMKEAFEKEYGNVEAVIDADKIMKKEEFDDIYNKYKSWEWNFGETPEFNISLEKRFSWGGIQFALNVVDGVIKDSKVYSDALETDIFKSLEDKIKDLEYDNKIIIKSISSLKDKSPIINDLIDWFNNKELETT